MSQACNSGPGEVCRVNAVARPEDVLSVEERDELRRRAEGGRIHHVAAQIGVTRETFLRLVGGFGVRRCTLAVARSFLAEVAP